MCFFRVWIEAFGSCMIFLLLGFFFAVLMVCVTFSVL